MSLQETDERKIDPATLSEPLPDLPENENPDCNNNIVSLLERLDEKFDAKIRDDEWKNRKYDEMHNLMLSYQNDMLAKMIDPLLKSIIQLSDSIKRDIKFYSGDLAQEQLCDVLHGITEQIDAILFDYDVEPYSADFGKVNSKEQKIVKTIPTEDKELDNNVAEILITGYKKADKIFRMEKVNIFKCAKAEE